MVIVADKYFPKEQGQMVMSINFFVIAELTITDAQQAAVSFDWLKNRVTDFMQL